MEYTLHYINNGYLKMTIIYIALIILIILLFVFIFLKIKKNIKDIKDENKKTQGNIKDIDIQLKGMKEDNKEVLKIHKQINDKSEVMSKLLEQTTRIYEEVLEKENEVTLQKETIDYEQINAVKVSPGEHLSKLADDINESSLKKQKTEYDIIKKIENVSMDSLMSLNTEELYDFEKSLEKYKQILEKEIQYYIGEIKALNDKNIEQSKRLEQKEKIYKQMKVVEEKIESQNILFDKISQYKENKIQELEKTKEEEKLDLLIKKIADKNL